MNTKPKLRQAGSYIHEGIYSVGRSPWLVASSNALPPSPRSLFTLLGFLVAGDAGTFRFASLECGIIALELPSEESGAREAGEANPAEGTASIGICEGSRGTGVDGPAELCG